jgi:hypothetical protein
MLNQFLLRALQQEIRRHDFNYFVHEPPTIAQDGRGVMVPGCPTCMKPINTMSQCLDHLAEHVMPALFDRLSSRSEPTFTAATSNFQRVTTEPNQLKNN